MMVGQRYGVGAGDYPTQAAISDDPQAPVPRPGSLQERETVADSSDILRLTS